MSYKLAKSFMLEQARIKRDEILSWSNLNSNLNLTFFLTKVITKEQYEERERINNEKLEEKLNEVSKWLQN